MPLPPRNWFAAALPISVLAPMSPVASIAAVPVRRSVSTFADIAWVIETELSIVSFPPSANSVTTSPALSTMKTSSPVPPINVSAPAPP
ncbi:MAG: hypothetical protein EOP59_06470, partial [Sphingomonadales bacterium]